MLRLAVVVVMVGVVHAISPAGRAIAEDHVVCPPGGTVCYVVAESPGKPGAAPVSEAGPRGAQKPTCRIPESKEIVPCFDPTFGWWSHSDGCYFQLLDPPPPPSDPAWNGRHPDGAIYETTCPGVLGTGGGWRWRATPPPRPGAAAVTAAELAAQAVAMLPTTGPNIGLAPDPAKVGLVGLPVWMWTSVSPSTWGPVSATATVPGQSVTATATAIRIVWDMGDGKRVSCAGPGTPYTKAAGATRSPTCGHVYVQSSASEPGAAYTITATTTWRVQWSGGGSSGELTETRSSSTRARIGELQVLVS